VLRPTLDVEIFELVNDVAAEGRQLLLSSR